LKDQTKELAFLLKLVAIITIASLISFGILYLLMNKWVSLEYKAAFQAISYAYGMMNFYIAGAVFVQLTISSVVVYFIALRYSHKIAGPIYKIRLTIQNYSEGGNIQKVLLRKNDFLHDLADNFTDFFNYLNTRKKMFAEVYELFQKTDPENEKMKQESLDKIDKILEKLQ
jgi:hypothetical protein